MTPTSCKTALSGLHREFGRFRAVLDRPERTSPAGLPSEVGLRVQAGRAVGASRSTPRTNSGMALVATPRLGQPNTPSRSWRTARASRPKSQRREKSSAAGSPAGTRARRPRVRRRTSGSRSARSSWRSARRCSEHAAAASTKEADRGLRAELRRQVASAGLGQRLANSWRDKHYPNRKLDAASLVYTKAPEIIRAFDEGAVIRSTCGRFLAILTENAPKKGTDGRRISPSTFPEHRFGTLRFAPWQSARPREGHRAASAASPAARVE